MDLSVILNPPLQSQCSVDLGGERSWRSQVHSPYPEATTGSEIHGKHHEVNGCLVQQSAVLQGPNNKRVSCPSSSSFPSLAPPRDNYCDQIQDQTLSTKVPRQRSITIPGVSSRSLKDSTQYARYIIPSHQSGHIHLQSNQMALPHCSSLETLASVATANATVRPSSHQYLRTSDTYTEMPLEATLSPGEFRPMIHSTENEQHQRAAPEDFECTTDPDSRRSSYAGGSARDPTNTTEEGPSCSYTAACSTASPLRKVVSHIFGRNKLCTRQIPKGVWVHYCRKHYQRSRYRNPSGFALLQCDLVRKQIDRLNMWGGVSNWIIKIRKREELRLNRENAELAAGRTGEALASDGDEYMGIVRGTQQMMTLTNQRSLSTNVGSHHARSRRTSRPTASSTSSRWLIKFTGSGKTTREVLEVLDIIETEIRDTKCNFPDIEILPNVSRPNHGSDHQRSSSSWSSSSLSSWTAAEDGIDHHETQALKRTTSFEDKSFPARTKSKRRTLQRGTRARL